MLCIFVEECSTAIVAEDADEEINFQSSGFGRDRDVTSSWMENSTVAGEDLYDFTVYMDEVRRVSSQLCKDEHDTFSQAPLTIQSHAPLELLHRFFVKLGARYVVVTDADGNCKLIYSPGVVQSDEHGVCR